MKNNINGKAVVFSQQQIEILFAEGFSACRDKVLFAITYYTACRISEALALEKTDILPNSVSFRREITKGKLRTREIYIHPNLRAYLGQYSTANDSKYLFPGRAGHLSRKTADKILRQVCDRLGIVGASTHSFRRTALTRLYRETKNLRTVQEISGHKTLAALQRYLEVTEEEKLEAISFL